MDKVFKTALVYPSYAAFNSRSGLEGTWINHGLATLIAYAEKLGEKVDLVDLRRLEDWDHFRRLIKDYDFVGYSVLTQDYKMAEKAISINREINQKVKICVGGVHVSVAVNDFINNKEIDYIITGEGELSFCQLIVSLKNLNFTERLIDGQKVDLAEIPFINRDNWVREKPAEFVGLAEPFFTMLGSRACMYNCSFCQPCSRTIFGKQERVRPPQHFINELKAIKNKYGLGSFIILDDNSFQNKSWLEKFIKLYKENQLTADFIMSARSNDICRQKDLLPVLSSIGLKYIICGFESGSQKILNHLRKGTTVEMNIEAAKLLHQNKIKFLANIMFGFSIEDKKDISLTALMVKKIKPDIFSPTTFTPYPGNDLAESYKKDGLILPNLGNLTRYPDRPKIKGVKYFHINWTLFKLQFFLAKDWERKIRTIAHYSILAIKIIKLKVYQWFYFVLK